MDIIGDFIVNIIPIKSSQSGHSAYGCCGLALFLHKHMYLCIYIALSVEISKESKSVYLDKLFLV